MRVNLTPYPPVRVDPETCHGHAVTCFKYHRFGYRDAEHLMWEWLFRWAGMPV